MIDFKRSARSESSDWFLRFMLLLHLVLGCTSSVLICAVWWLHFRARRRGAALSGYLWMIEAVGVAVVGLTGHLGGFLAGVNVG